MGSATSKEAPTSVVTSNVEPTTTTTAAAAASLPTATATATATATTPPEVTQESSKCPMHRGDGTYAMDWWRAMVASPHRPPEGTGSSRSTTATATATGNSSSSSDSDSDSLDIAKNHSNTNNEASSSPSMPLESAATTSTSSPAEATVSGTVVVSMGRAKGTGGGGCPVQRSKPQQPQRSGRQVYPEYNVYAQPIPEVDPANQMPSNPNQLPAPQQQQPLSTHRVPSTIPKGGGGGGVEDKDNNHIKTWTYPSPQMFYNALARKGKLDDDNDDDTTEADMEIVVSLHNRMNEATWQKVLQWEAAISSSSSSSTAGGEDDSQPVAPVRLLKFMGRPSDLSPKAAVKHYLLGHPLPFDRHDWTVQRADGSVARYVIDYYHDEHATDADNDNDDANHTSSPVPSLLMDVRPALDGVAPVWHRLVTMPYARHVSHRTHFQPLPWRPSATMVSTPDVVQESIDVWHRIQQQQQQQQQQQLADVDDEGNVQSVPRLTEEQARRVAQNFARMLAECRAAQTAVSQACGGDNDSDDDDDDGSNDVACARASLDLTLCLGRIACPLQHEALVQQTRLGNGDDGTTGNSNNTGNNDAVVEDALRRLHECLRLQTRQHRIAQHQHPHVFEK